MRKYLDVSKNFINENFGNINELFAASVSTTIGDKILEQGFNRTDRKRGSTYFINEYENGVNVAIITQVHFATSNIQIFFKLQLTGNRKTSSTNQEIARVNTEYKSFFEKIVSEVKQQIEKGEYDHLKGNFTIEYSVDQI